MGAAWGVSLFLAGAPGVWASELPPGVEIDCVAWADQIQGPPNPGPASSPAGYQDGDFIADVRDIFETLKQLTGLARTRLELRDGHPYCPVAAAVGDDMADAVFVCPNLAEIARNRAQLTFVMAHEFAHVEKGDWDKRQEAADRGIAAWKQSLPPGYFEKTSSKKASQEASEFICSGLTILNRAQEAEADERAVELLAKHRDRLRAPPSAGIDAVWQKKEFLFRRNRMEGPSHPTAAQRAQSIRLAEERVRKALAIKP